MSLYLGNNLISGSGNVAIDQVFDGTSANAQSGVAIQGQLDTLAPTVQNIATLSTGSIQLSYTNSIYKITPSTATTFTFDITNLTLDTSLAYTFELYINMSTVYTLTFPNTITWQDNETPDLSSTGNYLLVFRTMDGGSSWIGNLQGVW